MVERRGDPGSGSKTAASKRRVSAAAASREGLRQIAELTGKDAESVSGVQRSDDGWTVTVEVVEDRRIPSSTDVLGTYQAELGDDGDLLSYQRVRRYARGRGDDGDG
jgi:hypothetical protein